MRFCANNTVHIKNICVIGYFMYLKKNKLMENTLKNLRQLIRLYRLKKGYSQEAMGELLGISQSAYANIENGKNKITVDKLLEIMRLLDKISFWV